MTNKEKIEFVHTLPKSIANEIELAIKQGKIPEEWDGHELRALLRDKHEESWNMTSLFKSNRSKRAKAYRNHVLMHNL